MAKDSYRDTEREIEIEALKQQNEKMSLRIAQLDEQYKSKEKHLLDQIKRLLHIEESARGLCQKILDKDRREMVLGTKHSWSSIGSEEMIDSALKSYKQYCEKRTKDLKKISKYAEDLGKQLEESQNAVREKDAIIELYEKNKGVSTERAGEIRKMINTQGVDSQYKNLDLQEEDSEDENLGPIAKRRAEAIKNIKVVKNSSPVIKLSDDEYAKLKIEVELLPEFQKDYIALIGKGYAESREIQRNAPDRVPKGSSNRLFRNLYEAGYVDCVKDLKWPNSKNAVLYFLTEKGKGAYKIITGDDPHPSEMTKMITYHDNPEHGYGIKECAKLLETCNRYTRVNMFADQIKLPGGMGYRPDIVATRVDENGKETYEYFEYERCTQESRAYFEKFTKMALVTDEINIIVCTPDDHKRMINLISRWITALDATGSKRLSMYEKKRVRLGAYSRIANGIKDNKPFEDWWLINDYVGDYNQKKYEDRI